MRWNRHSAFVACLLTSLGACEHATAPHPRVRTNPEVARMQPDPHLADKVAHLASAGWQLTPLQVQMMMHPVSPEVAAGRPATRADREEVRGWFGPGELEMLIAQANQHARLSGADTLPHCLPLCDPHRAERSTAID